MRGVLAAARGIRPHLVELVGPADAALVDAELARLLAEGEDAAGVERRLREVLQRRVETRMSGRIGVDRPRGVGCPAHGGAVDGRVATQSSSAGHLLAHSCDTIS
jgi:hypothetical protein